MKNIGVTFNFDESILLDDKIQIPLNFYKTNHNFTIQFKQQLYTNTDNKENKNIRNLDTRIGNLDKLENLDTKFGNLDTKFGNLDTKFGNLDNFGYLDIKELEELINENYISTKNLYNSFINNTINEHEKLQQHIKNQQLEQQLLEQQKLENEQLEKQKLQNEQLEKEKLQQQQQLLLEQQQEQQLEKNVIDFIPKNMTIKIFDEMKENFKKLEEIYNEIKSNTELKSLRIELSKKIKICLNSIANTQKQVNLTFNNLSRILNESSENLKIFILFKIVEGVLNCCEQGQIYINPKSVWSFSRLLASIDHINNNFNIIFITLLTFKTILIIPKFYYIQSNTMNSVDTVNKVDQVNQVSPMESVNSVKLVNPLDMRLNRLYEYPEDINEEIIYNKRLSSYIRLYLSYLCIKNDFNTIWSYYANVINSSWNNIFIQFIPCLLITILNITSYFMYHIYKLQFIKILKNMKKLLENKLIKYNNTSSNQMYIGQLQQFYYDFKYVTVLAPTATTPKGFPNSPNGLINPPKGSFSYTIIKMRGLFEIPLKDDFENDLKEFSRFEKELRQIFNEITNYTRNLIEGKLNTQRIRINIENGNFSYYEIKHKKLNEINEIEDLINKYEKELNQIKPKFNELINKLNNMKINSEQTIQNYLNKY